MSIASTPGWFEIECQLNEILLRVSSGIPEECIMRSIGIPFDEWASYKVRHLNTSAPLAQFLHCKLPPNPYESKRKPAIHAVKVYAGAARCAP